MARHPCQVSEVLAGHVCSSDVTRRYSQSEMGDGRYYCDLHYRQIVWRYERKDVMLAGYDDDTEW
jgi:hypothetical protein